MRQSMIKGWLNTRWRTGAKIPTSAAIFSYINTIRMIIPKRKKMKTVMMSLYTERHGIQRGKKKEDVTGRCPVTFSFHLIL